MSNFIVGKITTGMAETCSKLLFDIATDISKTQNTLTPIFAKEQFCGLIDKNAFMHPFLNTSGYFYTIDNLPLTTEDFNFVLNEQLFAPVKNFFVNLWKSSNYSNNSKTVKAELFSSTKKVFESVRKMKTIVYESLQSVGYNAALGSKIAADAFRHVEAYTTHNCAKYVGNVMDRLGIHWERTSSAADLANRIAQNNRFKEVPASSVELAKLPAGCILVYPRGAANYSKQHGHVEITLGNGKAASDFVNNNIGFCENVRVFVPV